MKTLSNNKKIIRIIIFSSVFIIVGIFNLWSKESIKNKDIIYLIRGIQIILAIGIIWSLLSLLKNPFKRLFKNTGKILGRFLGWVFRPVLIKYNEIRQRRMMFTKGSDKNKFVWNFNISEKLNKIFKTQEKINLKNCRSNRERIRMLYIKNILQLSGKGYSINSSYTPKEIKNSLDFRESDVLFDMYEQVRYCEDTAVSEDEVKICERAGEKCE